MSDHRWTITLPIADNDGRPVPAAHDWITDELVATFGGYSAAAIDGAWRDDSDGRTYYDRSMRYEILVSRSDYPDELSERSEFARIAREAGRMARQECVMLTGPELVPTEFVGC